MTYAMNNPKLASLPEGKYPAIESLNGIQYLTLLKNWMMPKPMIDLHIRLASDASADPDLTPLKGLQFNGLYLIGDFSDPTAKEISATQITNLSVPTYGSLVFNGDNGYNGVDNATLKTLAPYIVKYSNNGQQSNSLMMNGSSVSDFSPLKDVNQTAGFNFNTNVGIYDPTPVYGIIGKPLTFTSAPVTGVEGEDLADAYNFTPTVSSTPAMGNLKYLGNDEYEIEDPDYNASTLSYGLPGFDPKYNPTYSMKGIIFKKYGTNPFINITMHSRKLIWEKYPNVVINYVDATGQPIMNNGKPLSKTVNGTDVGDPFDLTAESTVTGYTLTSPTTSLKGSYTLIPQVIKLVYSKNPASTSSNKLLTPIVKPAKPVVVEPASRVAAKIYSIAGDATGKYATLADMGVTGYATINGKLFYETGYHQFVAASEFKVVKAITPGVVRTFNSSTALVDSTGATVKAKLAPDTAWKYSKIVTIKGKDYYQVAADEFLPVSSSVAFTPTTVKTAVAIASPAELYSSEGKALGTRLAAGTDWKTDGCAIINGVKMYRVASGKWVSSVDTSTYEPVSAVFKAKQATRVYDDSGRLTKRVLPAGSAWKADRIVTIKGIKYCRVSEHEFVRADS